MNSTFIPHVSIVIPTFNHAIFLGKALNSIIDQTYENWEAIVIDNHSTDKTKEVIQKYTDPRIKYFKIVNGGIIAKSRNLGIKIAKGEWIAFLDSDDWWTSDKLETCFANIDDTVDFIYHDLEIIYNKSNSFFKRKKIVGRKLTKPILNNLLISGISKGSAIGNSSVIVRKKILEKIDGINESKSLVASEDYNTWLRIAQITNQFKYLKKKLGYYLVHDASSQNRDLSIPHRQAVIDFMELLNDVQKLNLEVKLRYISGNYNFLRNNFSIAKNDFMFVLRNGQMHFKLRSLLKLILTLFKNAV